LPVNSRPNSIEASHDQADGHMIETRGVCILTYINYIIYTLFQQGYQPTSGNSINLNQPRIPHGVVLREKSRTAPSMNHAPMTQFYTNKQEYNPAMSPPDFPAPPPFISEIKDLGKRAQPSYDTSFDYLPPPPPELMLHEAKNNHVSLQIFYSKIYFIFLD